MISVYDESINFIGIIDDYESLIFTRRFYRYGEFELYINRNKQYADKLQKFNIIALSKKEKIVKPAGIDKEIVEKWQGQLHNTKVENGILKLIEKNIWPDGSGNGNDGELMNFGYTEDSGWIDDRLKFDGVDDYIQLPELNLDLNNFTLQVDNKIRVFNGDKVITENMEDIAYTWKQFEGMTWEEVINL